MNIIEQERERIFAVLRDGKHTWRTAHGVSLDAKIPFTRTIEWLEYLVDDVTIAPYASERGERLYALRSRVIKEMSWIDRLRAAFRNRLV